MTQPELDLPLRALARATDPGTSHDAAGKTDAARLAGLVLDSLEHFGPATSHELAARLNLQLVSVSPRMKPLEDKGLVARDGKRGGRTVWRATRT